MDRKDIESALELYMADVERENEQLIELVTQLKQQAEDNQTAYQRQMQNMQARLEELERRSLQLDARVAAGENGLLQLAMTIGSAPGSRPTEIAFPEGQEAAPAAEEPAETKPSIKQRYPELFELHEQGKSVDAISRACGLQRGEVQLILQLAKQEESA